MQSRICRWTAHSIESHELDDVQRNLKKVRGEKYKKQLCYSLDLERKQREGLMSLVRTWFALTDIDKKVCLGPMQSFIYYRNLLLLMYYTNNFSFISLFSYLIIKLCF